MRAQVIHTLRYRYNAPVQLGHYRLCLQPRGHGFQQLLSFDLRISPEPNQSHGLVAASGDEILRARFCGSTNLLEIRAVSHVLTQSPPTLEACLVDNEPELPYPVGLLNSDLMGALEGWLPNGQHEPPLWWTWRRRL